MELRTEPPSPPPSKRGSPEEEEEDTTMSTDVFVSLHAFFFLHDGSARADDSLVFIIHLHRPINFYIFSIRKKFLSRQAITGAKSDEGIRSTYNQ